MFVAAAGVVEVGLSGSIVKEYVCVDDRIAGVEYRLVEQLFETVVFCGFLLVKSSDNFWLTENK